MKTISYDQCVRGGQAPPETCLRSPLNPPSKQPDMRRTSDYLPHRYEPPSSPTWLVLAAHYGTTVACRPSRVRRAGTTPNRATAALDARGALSTYELLEIFNPTNPTHEHRCGPPLPQGVIGHAPESVIGIRGIRRLGNPTDRGVRDTLLLAGRDSETSFRVRPA